MKRLLSIIGAISLVGTSTTSLVACKDKIHEYTPEELKELKEKNKINTTNENIKNNLEWIAPQEKPFNEVDNKYYYVVWRGDKNDNWRIIKFKHFDYLHNTKYIENNISLKIGKRGVSENISIFPYDLVVFKPAFYYYWLEDNFTYFKAVYRWNGEEQKLPNLDIDENGDIKVK